MIRSVLLFFQKWVKRPKITKHVPKAFKFCSINLEKANL